MSEQILNQGSMYESIQGIQELNQVEGFDPRKYMRQLAGDGQGVKYYLDVVYRKLWFRLKYPNGKIVKKLIKLTDQVAIVEAKVYLDRNDPEESFIANALAQKYLTGDDQFGNKYVELAETAAVGRALADAGFGLQFADLEGETDPAIVDAGIEHFADAGTENVQDAGTFQEMKTGAVPDEEVQLPGQYDIRDYMDQNENQQYADTTAVNTAAPFRRQCRWLAEAVQVQYRSRYRVKPRIDLRIRCRVRRTRFGIARQWCRELFLISRESNRLNRSIKC